MLRHWVVSAAAPRIASEKSPNGEVETFHWSVLDEGLSCIFRTGRSEAT